MIYDEQFQKRCNRNDIVFAITLVVGIVGLFSIAVFIVSHYI